jgi:hypothetical protein
MKIPTAVSDKNLKVDKSKSRPIAVVAIAAVVIVFCLFSIKALLAQGAYQRRVVNAKQDTVKQLKNDIEAAKNMSQQYDVFETANPNMLGARSDVPENTPPPDGKNSRLVLDALPVEYDFPALISSITKLMGMHGIAQPSIGGVDLGSSSTNAPSANPEPVAISQIPISGSSSFSGVQNLIRDFERSTRPYDITSLQLSFNSSGATLSLSVDTYYQPARAIILESQEVK